MSKRILVTIPASNYCEKARWGLQASNIVFEEEPHMPLFHYSSTVPKGGKTVPIFQTESSTLSDSKDILKFCNEKNDTDWLYPSNKETDVRELEEHFDTQFGPHARRLAYHALFNKSAPELNLASRFLLQPESLANSWEGTFGRFTFPLIKWLLIKSLKVNDEGAERSLKKVWTVFDKVEKILGDSPLGSKYLATDKFSAADLTFASHASLLLFPTECVCVGGRLTSEEQEDLSKVFAPEMWKDLKLLRKSKAGQFASYCYKNHR